MFLMIDVSSGVPVYIQIVEQIKRAIASGILQPGEILPSLRETALKLRVNARTVANAYKELEIEGMIETRHGAGSFVAMSASESNDGYRHKTLAKALDCVLLDAYQMDVPFDELQNLFNERMAQAIATYATERNNGEENEKI